MTPVRRQHGLSLVEVLVSLIVVSVGALSATSLQIVSKRTNWEATQRLQATHLASSLIERMRANNVPEALAAYAALGRASSSLRRPIGGGVLAAALAPSCGDDASQCCPVGTDCCLAGTACTADQVAAVELFQLEWVMDGIMEQVEGSAIGTGGLDSPTACIAAPAPAGRAGFYTVTIAFRGTAAMPDVASDAECAADPTAPSCCGRGATEGGRALYGANNEYRRTLTLAAFITPSVDK